MPLHKKIKMSTSNIEFEFRPNNTNLLATIKAFQKNQNQETFMAVFNELQGNNAFLLIPTTEPIVGKDRNEEGWSTIEKGTQMSFTSVFEVEGQKILGAFTSQQTLMNWANETKPFASLPVSLSRHFLCWHPLHSCQPW